MFTDTLDQLEVFYKIGATLQCPDDQSWLRDSPENLRL